MTTTSNNPLLEVSRLKYENENIKTVLNQIITEYTDYRQESDEICKEYEETIQLLTDSVEQYKSEITKINIEKEKMKQEQEKLTKELEKSREKNRDKIKDIEILNNKINELNSIYSTINKKETTLKSKVVTLETDNDHYLNRIHQYEEEGADLKDNLENTIENLIMTQNDFEKYKNKKEEELERLKLKLQEEKSTIKALMKQKSSNIHKRIKGSLTLDEIDENDEYEEIKGVKRKLSWNEDSHYKDKNEDKNEINMENIINKNSFQIKKINEEHEHLLEMSRGRMSRSLTIQKTKSKSNFNNIISNMRKRKEELVRLNAKIKKDKANYFFNNLNE